MWDAELWFGQESFLAALELIAEPSPLSGSSQDLLSLRGSMGQLNAQLAAPKQSHSVRGEDLHDPLRLPGGTVRSALSRVYPALLGAVTPPLGADGELHPTCGHHQRRLHGVSLPRCKALRLPFHPEPLWHRKLEGTRRVSVK